MSSHRLFALLVAASFSVSAFASVDTEMQSFFNQLGTYGNVTGPQALKGQTGTVFTGGNLYMRIPQRNYSVFHVAPPGIKSGCGGIDLFAGSFSFMNAEQLTALMQSLANNAIGVAFELAIESISPELAGILKWAQDQASKLNNMNLNSCQMATGLMTAAWPDQDAAQKVAARKGLDPQHNLSADSLKSWWNQLTNPPSQTRSETSATVASNPSTKELIDNVNVVWQALNRIGISDDEMRELMMSLTGTVIITRNKSDDSKPDITYRPPPQKLSFKEFIGSPEQATSTIRIMKCPDFDCLNPGEGTTHLASFAKYAKERIGNLIDKIRTRSAHSLSTDEYKFIQGSFVPIWKIVSMSGDTWSEGMAEVMSQIIAMDLGFTWFNEISRELHKAVMNSKSTDSGSNRAQLERFEKRIAELRGEAHTLMAAESARLNAQLGLQQNIARLHREIKQGLSEQVRQSIESFGRP